MSTIQTTELAPAKHRLAAIEKVERKQAALAAQRDELLSQLLEDLDWMDVPVQRVWEGWVPDHLRGMSVGSRVHIVRQYEERGTYDARSVHATDACGWYCKGEPGGIVKGGSRKRWRFLCEGTFEYIGIMASDRRPDYLFLQA